MVVATPEGIAAITADSWCDAFEQGFKAQTQARIAQLEYTDEVAAEMRRYMSDLFNWAAAIANHHPLARRQQPATTLHPVYKAMVEEAVTAQVERWRAGQAEFPPATLAKPLTPAEQDRANPRRLELDRNRLLNFEPAKYFGRPVPWDPPARFNVASFMTRYGLDELAPYTEKLRLTTDGLVNVKAASNLWFRLFGIGYDLGDPDSPLRVTNTVRPRLVENPQLLQFLELLV